MRKMVSVGIANDKETNMEEDVLCLWEPKDIIYSGLTVFFKYDDTYYSMKREDFIRIFNK